MLPIRFSTPDDDRKAVFDDYIVLWICQVTTLDEGEDGGNCSKYSRAQRAGLYTCWRVR